MSRARRARRSTGPDADVIIIGAGLAGLSAALRLHEAGKKVLVLEGRDRVGGKTCSKPVAGGGVVDLGAAWINSTNQSKIFALAKRFGLETITQNVKGDVIVHDLDGQSHKFPYGQTPMQEAEPGGVKSMLHVRDTFEALCQRVNPAGNPRDYERMFDVDYDKMNMEDFVKYHGGTETALKTVTVWTKAMLGLELHEVSALFFLMYCKAGGGIMQMRSDEMNGGQYLRFVKGTQEISKQIAAVLPQGSVQLSSPVVSIDDNANPSTVTVITNRRTFTARKIILAIPTVLYKTIMFSSALPVDKASLVDGSVHGHLSKVFLTFSSPWWREPKYNSCGLTQSLTGLIAVTRDTSNDSIDHYSLLGFIAGDAGRIWSKLSPPERQAAVFKHFQLVFGGLSSSGYLAAIPEPLEYVEQMWWEEPFSQGCPCPAMPPSLMSGVDGNAAEVLRRRHGNVHFAGTEMADVWRGYMDGAVRSGEAAAEEILGLGSETARL